MALFKKDNPNYFIVERNGKFFPIFKTSGSTHGPSSGFSSKETCQHWINTVGNK